MSLLGLRGRLFLVIFLLLIPFRVLGVEDFEKLCNIEIVKVKPNIKEIKKYCSKTGNYYFSNNNFESASWYYLLGEEIDTNINLVQKHISPKESFVIYANIGHSYILKGDFKKANKLYWKYINIQLQPNIDIEADYKLLYKLYPKYKNKLDIGFKNWKNLYSPLNGLEELYTQYNKYNEQEKYQDAIDSMSRIIQLREQYLDKNNENISTDYNNFSLLYSSLGDYNTSIKFCLKSLDITKRIFGENDHSTAVGYSNLGFLYEKISLYKEAEKNHLNALKIFKKLYPQGYESISITYNNLGVLYNSMGQYKKSLLFYEKSLQMDKKLNKKDSEMIIIYNNIGELYSILGNYPKSMEYYYKALEIGIKTYDNNHTNIAISYNNIGQIYEFMQDFKRSEKFHKKALKIFEEKFGTEHYFTATAHINLGNLYYSMNDFNKSYIEHKKALTIRQKLYNHPHVDIATSYNALGLLSFKQGDYNKSLKYYTQTLNIEKKILGEEHIVNAPTYHNLGLLYKKMGKIDKAIFYYNKSLELEKKIFGEQYKGLAMTYNDLALLYFSQRDNQKAYEYVKKTFEIFDINMNRNFTLLDSKQRKNYIKEEGYKFINLLYLANLSGHKNYFIINSWLKYKGTLFEYQNILSMLENNSKIDSKTKQNIKELKKLTRILDDLDNINIESKNYVKEKLNIEEQIHNIEVNLSKQNQIFKERLDLQKIEYSNISSKLNPNQLYIDFVKTDEKYYLFTLDNRDNISFEEVTKSIEQDINKSIKINQRIANNIKNSSLIKSLKSDTQQILSNLYDNLIKGRIKDKKITELIISPDGLLNFLPFEALYHNGRYLIEDYKISYISSGREFVRQTKREKANPKYEMICFGNPDFDATLPISETKGKPTQTTLDTWEKYKNFSNLGDAEIITIKEQYRNPLIYENKEATIENLMNIESTKILHLSTHGKFLINNTIKNPMLKAGLAFAGANKTENSNVIATALKLSTLDLKETELVVLSACESGLGDVQNAEGVVGLPKAFLQAGARNVIMSLWSVSNLETAKLMKYFYENINKGQDYATALRNAKLSMIEKHPYYWSAFIIHGIQN